VKFQKKVLLMGGIGNKLFQLARAVELQEKNIIVELVYIDPKMTKFYKLSGHTIHPEWIDIPFLSGIFNIHIRPITFIEFIQLVIKFFTKKVGLSDDFNINLYDVLEKRGEISWDVGYFQSKNHLSLSTLNKVADELIKILNIKKKNSKELTLHIRGGDFDTKNRIQKKQMEAIILLCQSLMLNLIVVTNDNVFSKKLLGETLYKFYKGKSAYDDFIKLASSSNLYLSNSTFAFWAAMIAIRSHSAKIYLPNNWPYSDFIKESE